MSTTLIPFLIGGLVIAAVALLYIALRRGDEGKASERLDQLVGRNTRKDSSADMLLKQALQEQDKTTLMDRLMPEFFNLTKVFEQADCNIKPSALFGISLALGLVGIYGVISYAVSEQRRAIGIRLALGAGRAAILGRFLGQGVRIAGVACLSGIVLSLAASGALSRLLYGVSPSDPTTLAGVALIVLVVATLAALIPATRAALLEPMRTLRDE